MVLLDLITTTRMLGSLLNENGDGKDYVTPKIQLCIFSWTKYFCCLLELKMRIRCNRLIELVRTGLEREKRPPHNFNFEHFTSLLHRGRQKI